MKKMVWQQPQLVKLDASKTLGGVNFNVTETFISGTTTLVNVGTIPD